MNSPLTGMPMELKTEKRRLPFRGEEFEVDYTFFLDTETGEEFVTPETGDQNLIQVYSQYNAKYGTKIAPVIWDHTIS